MHFALIAQPLRGHFFPLSVLAEELIGRGHRITFVHHPDALPLVDAPGATFAAIGGNSPSLESWTKPMVRIGGALGMRGTMRRMCDFTRMFADRAPALLREIGVDAVIADQLEPGGALVAEHLGLPWISTATTIPMNRELSVPPPYLGWSYDPSEAGLRRNRGGWAVSDLLMRKYNRAVERSAHSLGVVGKNCTEDAFSPLLQLSQSVAELEFPRRELPDTFHFTGPWRRSESRSFEVPASDGRPLVYASLGTLQGSRAGLFRTIAEACVGQGMRLLLTHGGGLDQKSAATLPGNPLVYEWVPQEQALRHADFVICHGGMNTVLDAMAAGIPTIVLPLAFEQAGIGARVAHCGAGIIASSRISARKLGGLLNLVASASTYRDRARKVAAALKSAGGVTRAADLIEQALGVSARPARPTTAHAAPDDARDGNRSENR